tara:strand:+ start:1222 stop:5313 length:4092 start_codon:yes stop_codon:yes gene_type:complete
MDENEQNLDEYQQPGFAPEVTDEVPVTEEVQEEEVVPQVDQQPTNIVEPTDSGVEPVEKTRMQRMFGVGNGVAGTQLLDYSGGGFIYDEKGPVNFYKPGGAFQKVTSAPALGTLDTFTDGINMITPKGIPDIPYIQPYEEKQIDALRKISGLIIPSLGARSMMMNAASKYHASGAVATKLPWLHNLGNKKSFAFFAERGVDMFTGGVVDLVAKQNETNSTLADMIVEWNSNLDVFIPDYLQTGPDSTADQVRVANVLEGGIFNVLFSVFEAFSFIKTNGRSVKKTARFVNTDGSDSTVLNKVSKGKFDDVVFNKDNPIEDAFLRKQAEHDETLKELGTYYTSKSDLPNKPTVGLHDVFDANEELVITTKGENPLPRAKVQAAEINNNIDSAYGRISAIISEAARKNGLELENLVDRTLVNDLAQNHKQLKKFNYKTNNGKIITDKMIKDASDHLVATLLHPRVDKEDILGILSEFKHAVDDSAVRIVGKKALTKAVKQLKSQLIDLDLQKARAYLVTSEAGQISDMLEGARLSAGSSSVERTVELMADRLEVLMVEAGLAKFEANSMLQNMDAWKKAVKTGDKDIINATAEAILADHGSRLTELIPKAKKYSHAIKQISKENPDFLESLLLASEFADGNVDSLYTLHNWAQENFGTWGKFFRDKNPKVPSIINRSIFSNLFNGMLSSPTTPVAAGVGNLTGLFGKSQAQIWGHAFSGDWKRMKQAMTAWYSIDDTFSKASDQMRVVFRKASTNPKEYSYIMREDFALKETKELTALRSYAKAASKNGEDGASAFLRMFDDLEAMAADPALRFGPNGMSGLDGFSNAVLGNAEAKYRALWKATKEGEELTPEAFKKASEDIYNSFFDSNGIIKSDVLDSASSEIKLNADSPLVTNLNNLLKDYPILKTFIWYPRTTANVYDVLKKWSPAGTFSDDWKELHGLNSFKKLEDFKDEEIIHHLTKRGLPVDEFYKETFATLRAEVKGKAAISGTMLSLAFMAGFNDRCTGTGHVNKAIQSARENRGWKKKMCTSPIDGKQYSYEWMGPIGDWMALAIDLVDNADTLNPAELEKTIQTLWVIGANTLSDKRVLSQLEPMFDILQGNGGAANRWASNLLNNALPLGNARNWLGKTMYPQLREVRSEFGELLRNRNAWLDMFDPERALPDLVDPVDGLPIGGDKSWWERVGNTVLKTGPKIGPYNQWLIDIEYPVSPTMNLSNKGARLETSEIRAINSIIGKQGFYREELQSIKDRADSLRYTDPHTKKTYKGFREVLRAVRRGNISTEVLDAKDFANIYRDITSAYNNAKRTAEETLQYGTKTERLMWARIQAKELQLLERKNNAQQGDLEAIYQEKDRPLSELEDMFK